MTTTPPEAPPDQGPRVTRDEVRDLGRLRRTSGDRKIAGVAGGIARHTDVDPLVVRVGFVVLALFGAGLLVYAVCWLIVPRDDTGESTVRLDDRSRSVALMIAAGVGALALLGRSVWGFPWPLAVAGTVVLVVMFLRGSDRERPRLRPARSGPVPTYAAPEPAPPAPPLAARRNGPVLFWYALALVALGEGLLGIADGAGAGIASSAYPALAVGVCAATLLVGAFYGRAGGVILLGLVATVATTLATVGHEVDTGHVADTPRQAADVDASYRLGAGEVELDLTDVRDLDALDGRTIDIHVAVGRVYVLVPDDLDVTVNADVGVGNRTVFGDESHDSGTSTRDGGPGAPTLTIDAHVNLGQVEIVVQQGATR